MVHEHGCQNDEARSMRVCGAKAGTRIRVYDDPYHRRNDDWSEIFVKEDMNDTCDTVATFQISWTFGKIDQIYWTPERKNLDGKVSSFTVEFGKCQINDI